MMLHHLCQEKLFHCQQFDLLSGGYFDIPRDFKGTKGGIQKEGTTRKPMAWPGPPCPKSLSNRKVLNEDTESSVVSNLFKI